MTRPVERIAVLLSGGVDSALALALLREAGHQLTAYYLKIWLEEELAFLGDCPWEEDLGFARAVCDHLQVPLQVVPFQTEYQQAVVEYVLSTLRAGHTPSPDVLCNRAIKFGAFYDRLAGTYDAVASGHYARIVVTPDHRCHLLRGVDPGKDQSYFLAYLRRERLQRLRFPLGDLHKREVRAMARDRKLAPSARKDSQGICFLGKLSYRAFVRAHLGEAPGEIRELGSGARVGTHRGHWFHTIGQRQGLGLGDGPWYVVAKDVAANTVYVAHDPAAAAPREVLLTACNWIEPLAAADLHERPMRVRIRHGDVPRRCRISTLPAAGSGTVRVLLDEPLAGIASGQFAVLYGEADADRCYGAGVMQRAPGATADGRLAQTATVPAATGA